jgi:hypothetical protein
MPYPYPQPAGHGPWVMVGMGFIGGHTNYIHVFNFLLYYNYQTTLQASAHRHGVNCTSRGVQRKEKKKKRNIPGDMCVP